MQLVVECQSTADIKADMSTFQDILDSRLSSLDDIQPNQSNGDKEDIFENDLKDTITSIFDEDTVDGSEMIKNIIPQNDDSNSDEKEKPTEAENSTIDLKSAEDNDLENDNESSNLDASQPVKEEPLEEVEQEINKILEQKLINIQNDTALISEAEIKTETSEITNTDVNTGVVEIKTEKVPEIKNEEVIADTEPIISTSTRQENSTETENYADIEKVEQTSESIEIEADKNDECIEKSTIEEESSVTNEELQTKVADCIENIDDDIAVVTEKAIEIIDLDKSEKSSLNEDVVKDVSDENEVMEVVPSNENETKSTEETDQVSPKDTNTSDLTMEVDETPEVNPPESVSNNHIIDLDEITDSTVSTETVEKSEPAQIRKEPEKRISRLSNNLDILSDDEEESTPTVTKKNEAPVTEETKIDPVRESAKTDDDDDDDDDIVVIEDAKDTTDEKSTNNEEIKTDVPENEKVAVVEECAEKKTNFMESIELSCNKTLKDEEKELTKTDEKLKVQTTELLKQTKERKEEIPEKPLVTTDFLKTSKKTLASMTRDELEEFCILKIVESVVDRINFSETQTKLKTLSQHLDDYEKKSKMLAKQNRDLQVVLKSIQEEQKKTFSNSQPITPLKITRSVGMQVLMPEKTVVTRKKSTPQAPNVVPPLSVIRTRNQTQASQKPTPPTKPPNNENIPVPRLIPANNSAKNNTPIKTPSPSSSKVGSPMNGIRTAPPQKVEKRSMSKDQATVDLTDDEPPAKIIARNPQPPVRLVSPQSLMAPQRSPFGQAMNSPRKVFIPINSTNNSVRPTPTVMIKTHHPGAQRQRPNTPMRIQSQIKNRSNMPHRHPAPLPEIMKQYNPPNWKALPPAPDLKLSKVENGIVISWKINGYQEDNHEEIASYQLYAYQETAAPPNTALWKKIGDVKALPLPMACTLTQFTAGYSYYFAVRAVDVKSRLGPFSEPSSILLPHKM